LERIGHAGASAKCSEDFSASCDEDDFIYLLEARDRRTRRKDQFRTARRSVPIITASMIQLSTNFGLPEREIEIIPIKVVGVGTAGSNALDRILLDGIEKSDLAAINTDVQSLASSVAACKVQIGRAVTHGLGTGGDPELGYQAAIESTSEIDQAFVDARMLFICAGLGGGTGSGAAPVIAQLAREAGLLVIVLATLPFSFEGKRRAAQAHDALSRLNEIANAVICFENDRMGDMVGPKTGIHQAFAAADMIISQSVRSIVNLIQRPGLIRIGFDDLFAALRSQTGRCLFGFGESESDNRTYDALKQAFKSPLMDKGKTLSDATRVLVQITGGPSMTLSEVEILMQELGRHIRDHTQILFGTAVDGRMGNRLSVTIISSHTAEGEVSAENSLPPLESFVTPPPPILTEPQQMPAPEMTEIGSALAAESTLASENLIPFEQSTPVEVQPEIEKPAPPPRLIAPKKKPLPAKEPAPAAEKLSQAKQEVLQFEPVTRGRFEKSEPTIIEGQDLDVPTFLRKNVRVK
jgi:cell division protein FtsZ